MDRISIKQALRYFKKTSIDQSPKKEIEKKKKLNLLLLLQILETNKKTPAVSLNANRAVTGTLRGFDQFMNIVLDGAVDDKMKQDIGMVVSRRRRVFCFVFLSSFSTSTSTSTTEEKLTSSFPSLFKKTKKTSPGHPRQLDRDDHGPGADRGYMRSGKVERSVSEEKDENAEFCSPSSFAVVVKKHCKKIQNAPLFISFFFVFSLHFYQSE